MARRDKKREDLMLGVKLGLFEHRHRQMMGPAVWLVMPPQALTQLNGGTGISNSPSQKSLALPKLNGDSRSEALTSNFGG